MQDLKFLPLTQEAVEQKVAAFRTYMDEIRRSLPDVLLAMMTLLLNQYRAKYVLMLHTYCWSKTAIFVFVVWRVDPG